MRDFPSPAFLWVAGVLALLILALGPALDGASPKEAAMVPALMAVWAGLVALIDRALVPPSGSYDSALLEGAMVV